MDGLEDGLGWLVTAERGRAEDPGLQWPASDQGERQATQHHSECGPAEPEPASRQRPGWRSCRSGGTCLSGQSTQPDRGDHDCNDCLDYDYYYRASKHTGTVADTVTAAVAAANTVSGPASAPSVINLADPAAHRGHVVDPTPRGGGPRPRGSCQVVSVQQGEVLEGHDADALDNREA